jgi:hypothetical protein
MSGALRRPTITERVLLSSEGVRPIVLEPTERIDLYDPDSRRFGGADSAEHADRSQMVERPWQEAHLSPGHIALRVRDDDVDRYSAHVSLPLSALDTAPLTAGEFAASIVEISLPGSWGDRARSSTRAAFAIHEGTIEIDVRTVEPGAWTQSRPTVMITLASGQLVAVQLSTERIPVDFTAFSKTQAEKQLAEWRKIVATLAHEKAEIARYERMITAMESRLAGDTSREIHWAHTRH